MKKAYKMGNKEKKGRKEEKRKEDITGMKNWLNYLFICLSVGEEKKIFI